MRERNIAATKAGTTPARIKQICSDTAGWSWRATLNNSVLSFRGPGMIAEDLGSTPVRPDLHEAGSLD